MDDLQAYVILNAALTIPKNRVPRLLETFGGPLGVFAASPHDWAARGGLTHHMAKRLDEARRTFRVDEEILRARSAGIRIMTLDDADYPENLREIHDPPCVLYISGSFDPDDKNAVGVVGSRGASYYGLSVARDFSAQLASFGLSIVSGMARGIDAAAHRATLDVRGRTLAVLGSGLNNPYPNENRELSYQIARDGVLISEFPLDTTPMPQNFPVRNRIVSGLSRGVLVVEASLRSGALITARLAAEQGRDVFAIPGKLSSGTSDGTNDLIKHGAHMVTSPQEILKELRGVLAPQGDAPPRGAPLVSLTDEEQRLFVVLDDEPKHIDAICRQAQMDAARAAALLLQLELKAAVRQVPGRKFIVA